MFLMPLWQWTGLLLIPEHTSPRTYEPEIEVKAPFSDSPLVIGLLWSEAALLAFCFGWSDSKGRVRKWACTGALIILWVGPHIHLIYLTLENSKWVANTSLLYYLSPVIAVHVAGCLGERWRKRRIRRRASSAPDPTDSQAG